MKRTIKRRRKEGKTDYKARLGFLKSDKPRVVVRKTNKYIIGQIVLTDIAQDRVVVSVTSKDLLDSGWPKKLEGSLKSLSACYLTGYLLGKKSKDINEGILDIGLQRNIKKSRLYAFLRGLNEGGFSAPHNKDSLPNDEELTKNEKTGKLIAEIKEGLK